jgi:hypothetical protein
MPLTSLNQWMKSIHSAFCFVFPFKAQFLFTIFFTFFSITLHAQGVSADTITWGSNSLVEKHSNENVVISTSIKTFPHDRVEIQYPNETLSFSVVSVSGAWTDPAENGQIIFHVKSGGIAPGKVTIKRQGSISIDVDFTEANDYGLHHVFSVSQFIIE